MFSDIEHIQLSNFTISEEVLDILTPEQVKKLKVIPLSLDDSGITFAIEDPNDFNKTDRVAFIFPDKLCNFKCASREDINDSIDKYYSVNEYDEFLKQCQEDDPRLTF